MSTALFTRKSSLPTVKKDSSLLGSNAQQKKGFFDSFIKLRRPSFVNSQDVQGNDPAESPLLQEEQIIEKAEPLENLLKDEKEIQIQNPPQSSPKRQVVAKARSRSEVIKFSPNNPFAFHCPYLFCREELEAFEFPNHAFTSHKSAEDQAHPCPICIIQEENLHHRKANLQQHLQSKHKDLLDKSFWSSNEEEEEEEHHVVPRRRHVNRNQRKTAFHYEEEIPNLDQLSTPHARFVVEQITVDIDKECSICFEDFTKGSTICRLECFCVYHKTCLDAWFNRALVNVCPLHAPVTLKLL